MGEATSTFEILDDKVEDLTNEPRTPSAEMVEIFGAPYLIIGWVARQNQKPNTFPMMHLAAAISAAREIFRDGSYYRIQVVDNYKRFTYAEFNRWIDHGIEFKEEMRGQTAVEVEEENEHDAA